MTTPKRSRPSRPRSVPPPLPVTVVGAKPLPVAFWVGIGAGATFLVLGMGILVYFLLPKDTPPTVAASDSDKPRERKTRPAPQVSEDEFFSPQEKARRETAAEKKPEQVAKVEPKQEPPKVVDEESWDRTLKTLEGYLVLPPRDQVLGMRTSKVETLTQIHVEDPKQIDLTIYSSKGSTREVGSADSDTVGFIIRAEDEESDEGQLLRRWIVQRKHIDPFTKLPRFAEIARFELAEQTLTFLWNMEAPDWARANSLPYCVLEISHKAQSRRLRLSKPKAAPQEPYNLASRDHKVNLAVHPHAVTDPDALVLDLQLGGVSTTPFSKNGMRVGDKVKFATRKPAIKVGDPQIEFEVQFAYDGKEGPHLVLNVITSCNYLKPFTPQEQKAIQTVPIQKIQGPTILTDFAKIKKAATDNLSKMRRSPQYQESVSDFPKYNQQLESLRSKVQKEGDPKKRKDMEEEISRLQSIINAMKEVFKLYSASEDIIAWADEMEPHFADLAKTARVGYSLYITIDGEKVYLARTEREESPAKSEE